MEPVTALAWGLASGIVYAGVALRVDRIRWQAPRRHAQDFYVLGWWALSATGFLAAAHAAIVWSSVDDLALLATLRLGLVLSFVLAVASLIAAAGHLMTASGAVKSAPPARRPS